MRALLATCAWHVARPSSSPLCAIRSISALHELRAHAVSLAQRRRITASGLANPGCDPGAYWGERADRRKANAAQHTLCVAVACRNSVESLRERGPGTSASQASRPLADVVAVWCLPCRRAPQRVDNPVLNINWTHAHRMSRLPSEGEAPRAGAGAGGGCGLR